MKNPVVNHQPTGFFRFKNIDIESKKQEIPIRNTPAILPFHI